MRRHGIYGVKLDHCGRFRGRSRANVARRIQESEKCSGMFKSL
jgi:hypothetical protein